MQHPYQCVAKISPPDDEASYLLAACGPKLLVVSAKEGVVTSSWSSSSDPATQATAAANDDNGERPKKKQKTAPPVKPANIIKLAVSPDQQHAVAVTDDKYVRVFSIDGGTLSETSQRCMPKRPCAIQVLPDNATIICGDKFGDVYSLPLLFDDAVEGVQTGNAKELTSSTAQNGKPVFKPSATNLTVHTQRNRKALESQMQQKNFSAKKEPLKFEHKLLLGHVSMLTDVLYATYPAKRGTEFRGYIITADRDEHIRISRGPDQAHVIEGYCLGHKEFVSKLCLVPGTTGSSLLVSGGGDPDLRVWDWHTSTLVQTVPLCDASVKGLRQPPIKELYRKDGHAPSTPVEDMAVCGMWTVPYTAANGKQETALVVAVERMPALFIIPADRLHLTTGRAFGLTVIDMDHPPLDVAWIGNSMVVSFDARDDGQVRLRAYNLHHVEGQEGLNMPWRIDCVRDDKMEKSLNCLADRASPNDQIEAKALDDLLYGVANLRKRRGWGAPPKDGVEGAEEHAADGGAGEEAEDD